MSACGKVSRVRHMVRGGSRESLPKHKVRLADQPPGIRKHRASMSEPACWRQVRTSLDI
jgi:hypothetical protein